MPDRFEILHKDLAGRIGRLSTPHGTIETPCLMPVVNPHIPLIPPAELEKMGAEMIITNSYIIHQDEELKRQALERGLHELLGFSRPIMTDSGAFQLSVYGDIDVSSRQILDFQFAIKSDISVPLDIPTPPDVPRDRAESELQTTEERLLEASGLERQALLAAPIQGSTYPDLRERAARFAGDLPFDVFPVGAVVPLMEAYRYSDLVDAVVAAKKGLGSGRPVHLFGAGHPMIFALAAAMGCDLFDSAAYALYARQDRYLTVQGTGKLAEMSYLPCSCPVCQGHTLKELMDSPERDPSPGPAQPLCLAAGDQAGQRKHSRGLTMGFIGGALPLTPSYAGWPSEAGLPGRVAGEAGLGQKVDLLLHQLRGLAAT